MEEIWKIVDNTANIYEVSDQGRVRSNDRYLSAGYGSLRFHKGRVLAPRLGTNGYHYVQVNGKNGKSRSIHSLVATAFILNPENKPHVNHLNGIRTDNRVENLEWVTPSENIRHCIAMGRDNRCKGANHPYSRKIYQYDLEGNFIKEWLCTRDIFESLGIPMRGVLDAIRRDQQLAGSSYGFVWKTEKLDHIGKYEKRYTHNGIKKKKKIA